jgi:hypothetical protein
VPLLLLVPFLPANIVSSTFEVRVW